MARLGTVVWLACTLLVVVMLTACWLVLAAAAPVPPASQSRPGSLLDVLLREASICWGPDGVAYLTGTRASQGLDGRPDFENNDGVGLWRSKDLKAWQNLGLVWDMLKVLEGGRRATTEYYDVVPEIDGFLAHGMTGAELHYLQGTFWICYSMNGQGTALLKSQTGKAEGPYEDIGWITRRGGHPSMFEDADGTVYWLFNDGWIAKMAPDMSSLAEQPRLLRPAALGDPGKTPLKLARCGFFMFRRNGRYYLTGADYTVRDGKASYDSFVAVADNVYGPYRDRRVLGIGTGPVTVGTDPAGTWWAAFSQHDAPVVVELTWNEGMPQLKRGGP